MASSPQFAGTARTAVVKLVNATGTAAQTLLTIGATGGIIESLFVTSNDTTASNLTLLLSDGTTEVLIDTITIPAATAEIPVQQVSLMSTSRWRWLDPGNVKMILAASCVIKVKMEVAVSAGSFETSVVALYGEF